MGKALNREDVPVSKAVSKGVPKLPSKREKGAGKVEAGQNQREPLGEKPANPTAPQPTSDAEEVVASKPKAQKATGSKRKGDSIESTEDMDSAEGNQNEVGNPPAKKARKSPKTSSAGAATKATKAKEAKPADISDVHLEGEDNDAARVFESCGEIRKKIDAYLKRDGVKQVDFLKDLTAQYHTSAGPQSISAATLRTFRTKKGVVAGNTSSVYYAAYVFFEKLRIKEGKPKSKFRQEMEEAWPKGVDISRPLDAGRAWCGPGEVPYTDKYGRIQIGGRMPRA